VTGVTHKKLSTTDPEEAPHFAKRGKRGRWRRKEAAGQLTYQSRRKIRSKQ